MSRKCVNCSIRMKSIMSDLSSEELEKVEKLLVKKEVKEEQILFKEGDKMHGCYIVEQGKVKLFKASAMGEGQILRIITQGEIVGLCSLRNKKRYGHTAQAMEGSKLCYLNKSKLDHMLALNPKIMDKVISSLANEVEKAYERIYVLGTKSAKEKIAKLLISLVKGSGLEFKDGVEVNLSLSRSEMAELFGVSTETVIRNISDLKQEGILSGEGKKLFIEDVESLKEMVQ